jgi:hypothetical protein
MNAEVNTEFQNLAFLHLLQHSSFIIQHCHSGSIAASSGNPFSLAKSMTVATFVSATSCG